MNDVLFIWTDCNPSTMEKNHLMLNGLEKTGTKTYALGFCHSVENKEYFEKAHLGDVLYSYEYGYEGVLYQGGNVLSKLLNNLKIMLDYSIRLYRYCRKHRCSAIIVPPQPFELTLPTMLVGKLSGIKIVPNLMEYYPALPDYYKRKKLLQRLSWRMISKYSDAFIVISKFLKEKFDATDKNIFILPAILSENNITNKHGRIENIESTCPKLIYTSSYAYDDLLQFCMDTLSIIKDKNFTLTITGDYPENVKEVWLEVIKNYGLDGKVIFSGLLSADELYKLQINSTALLIPLINNERHCARFPQKVLSYMALGKPIVTTFVGELAEYFTDGKTVIMDMTATPDGFAEKIVSLLDAPDKASEIGRNGSIAVRNIFSDASWGVKMKEFISQIDS